MDEIRKIATRQSYGEALAELGEKNENVVVFDSDLSGEQRHQFLQKNSQKDFLIWELQNKI